VLPTVISRSICQGTAIGKLALPVVHTYQYGGPSMTYAPLWVAWYMPLSTTVAL